MNGASMKLLVDVARRLLSGTFNDAGKALMDVLKSRGAKFPKSIVIYYRRILSI